MSAARDISIGMGEYAVKAAAEGRLMMILGSCVGIVMADRKAKVVAVLHAMLPTAPRVAETPTRYVNTGVPFLVGAAVRAGARRERLTAMIVGGANMFPKLSRAFVTHLGKRNVEEARRMLAEVGVAIAAEDVGGTAGRVVAVDAATGAIEIREGDRRRRWEG